MNTECLSDNEFYAWCLFYFHCKIWDGEKFINITYSNSDKEQTLEQFKQDCEDRVMGLNNSCWIRSIRKGKRVYPDLHQRVLDFNKLSEKEQEKALDTRDNVGV
jgi:hypothetical protein|tara:strand:+ start:64 stop:375 length:312 start_codon:yes stop_codon:yes gene_type:complete